MYGHTPVFLHSTRVHCVYDDGTGDDKVACQTAISSTSGEIRKQIDKMFLPQLLHDVATRKRPFLDEPSTAFVHTYTKRLGTKSK